MIWFTVFIWTMVALALVMIIVGLLGIAAGLWFLGCVELLSGALLAHVLWTGVFS